MNQKVINNHLFLIVFLLTSIRVSAANETLKTGSFIINMGVLPQTIGNGLKPHGMIYDLVKNFNVPIKWSINPAKAKDGIDFTYNAIDYKGGTFIVPAEYRTAAVNARITYWQTQGVIGVTTTAPITVPIYVTIYVMPVWTLDAANGAIAAAYFTNAGIPATAYNSLAPSQLTACNDLFVMPHADPTWATHSNLYFWNKNAKGAIWVACHAISVLENVVNPANAAQKMNFLGTTTLILNGSHANGTPPYSYSYPIDPVMQFMGNIDLAQLNGSEQIYLPSAGGSWRAGVKVGVYDATQANVPVPSAGPAATLVYGYGFDDPTCGRVMYEGGHSHNKGTADDVSAQRAFFNFSMLTALEKAIVPAPTTTIALNDTLYSGTTEAFTFSLPAGSNPASFPIVWSTNCGGTFSPNATQQNVTYMPPNVTTTTPCLVSVQVTDSCGRKFSNARSVTVLCPMNVSNTATNIVCNGAATGTIKFTASSSTAPYAYNWTRGVATGNGTTTTIPSLIAGTYNVTVTSATGCTRSFTQILTEPPPLSINVVSTNILCKGAATGAIDITVSNGTAPYTYNWGSGITTEDRANLLVGTYNLTVTDAIGCTKTTAVTITEGATLPPVAPVATVVQPTCSVATGTITVTSPSTGVTYSFDNGLTFQVSATSGVLAAGTYQVVVKSTVSGCISTATAKNVTAQPTIPPLPITSVAQPTCSVATGVITVTSPSTGVTYSFNNGGVYQASAISSALVAGSYQVIAKNTVSGCSSAATATTINVQPSTPSVPTLSATAPTCSVSTASITITAPTGAGMTYSIDGVDYTNTTGIFNGVSPNTYTVTAKSASGCASAGTTITINPIVETPILSLTQPNCLLATGGAVATFPTGAGYTYSIDGVDYSNTTGSFTNLTPNTYTLTAKNASNCVSAGAIFTINPPVQTPIVTVSQPTCTVVTGVITVTTPSTGVTYSFDNGTTFQASATSNPLAIDVHQVVAKDNTYGCLSMPTPATINPQPAIPSVPTTSVSQPTCTVATGTITVTSPSSGVTYSFDNGVTYQATNISSALTADTYQVVAKDNTSGCASMMISMTVNVQPLPPSVPTTSASQPTCTVAMGTITVTSPSSGVTYSFDNGVTYQATATSSPLAVGVYQVIVKDNAYGCASASTSETINAQPVTPSVPTTTVIEPTCTVQTGTITIINPLDAGMTYSIDGVDYTNTTGVFTNLASGTYNVTAKSADGCVSPATPVTFVSFTQLDLKVFLEGAYKTNTETMQTVLNQRGLLPGQSPIGEFGVATSIGQPYKIAPWNYAGTEGDTITTYPPTVVDWVLVSLRTDSTSSTNIFRAAGWLHTDGNISFSPSCFTIPNGSYFVLIEHRNHIGVLSPTKIPIVSNTLTQDFTLNESYIRTNPPSFGQRQKGTKWVMFAGDGQKSTPITNYDINFNDSQLWKIQSGIFDQYMYGDFNMDADINFSDSFLWKLNSGKYSGVVHW
jgi:hypothetical protein